MFNQIVQQVFDKTSFAMLVLDENTKILHVNSAANSMLEKDNLFQVGSSIDDYLSDPHPLIEQEDVIESLGMRQYWQGHRRLSDSPDFSYDLQLILLSDKESESKLYLLQITDNSSMTQINEQLERLSLVESVTELPNRHVLMNRLGWKMAEIRGQKNIFALIYIDLDDFKQINDIYGHSLGNKVIKRCASRLTDLIEEPEALCSMGSDEFVVMVAMNSLDKTTAFIEANQIADDMRRVLQSPMVIEQKEHFIRASVGFTLFPEGLKQAEDIFREAETAMYHAKNSGGNRVCGFEPEMLKNLKEFKSLESALRVAISKQELQIYLQPQVDLDGNWASAEALLRWNHSEQGMISPAVFIPIAEKTDLIIDIGSWVIEQVCEMMQTTQLAGKPLPISVNVSSRQFSNDHFSSFVIDMLQTYHIDNQLLTLEITESVLLNEGEEALPTMLNLSKEYGVKFSLDDFGTGYSSLSYLQHLPIHELKIDQSFIRDMQTDMKDAALVELIINIAKKLNLTVVAEGVETEQQSQLLNDQDCSLMQGYLFEKPLPADIILDSWLATK